MAGYFAGRNCFNKNSLLCLFDLILVLSPNLKRVNNQTGMRRHR